EVAAPVRAPDRDAVHRQRLLDRYRRGVARFRQRRQHGLAEAHIGARAIGDGGQVRKIVRRRGSRVVARADRERGAHAPPSTRTRMVPRSGQLGSLSTRRISLGAGVSASGRGLNCTKLPRWRYWIPRTPRTPGAFWIAASIRLRYSGVPKLKRSA